MPLLRMRNATFVRGDCRVGPITLDLWPNDRMTLVVNSDTEAAIVARLACGIVKASAGSVLIGDYDPRLQSVHCKRIAAFVPHEPAALHEGEFLPYVRYRAALWNLTHSRAMDYAGQLRHRLGSMHAAFAFPIVGALIGTPRAVVFDRPQPAYAEEILAVCDGRAFLSTHTSEADAQLFAAPLQRGELRA